MQRVELELEVDGESKSDSKKRTAELDELARMNELLEKAKTLGWVNVKNAEMLS